MHEETAPQGEISLRDYIDLLRRRKAIVFTTFVTITLIGAIVAYKLHPWYRSEASLLIDQANEKIVSQKTDPLESLQGGSSRYLNTQTKVLMIQPLLEQAVMNSLDIYKDPGEQDDNIANKKLIDKTKKENKDNSESLDDTDLQDDVPAVPKPDPIRDLLKHNPFYRSGRSISTNSIKILTPDIDDKVDIIPVAVEALDPYAAQIVAENLMKLYIKHDTEASKSQLQAAIDYAKAQSKKAQDDWTEVADKVKDFKKNSKMYDYNTQLDALNQGLASLEETDHQTETDIQGKRATIAASLANLKRMPSNLTATEMTTNPAIAKLSAEVSDLQAQLQAKLEYLKPSHPTIKSLSAQIDSLQSQLKELPANIPTKTVRTNPDLDDTKSQLFVLNAQVKQKEAQLSSIRVQEVKLLDKITELGKNSFKSDRLFQKMDLKQERYRFLQGKLADLKLEQQSRTSPISILTHATYNPTPIRPKKFQIVLFSSLAGLLIGICLAMLKEFVDDRVNSVDDARKLLPGLSVLGVIPRIDSENMRLLTARINGDDKLAADKRISVLESFRKLRSNVKFAALGEPLQTIMVTSTKPGEGKSTTAVNLAVAMAMDNKKVILVDIDLRLPTIHDKFGIRNTTGLTKLLDGTVEVEDIDSVMRDVEIEHPYAAHETIHLKVLTAGPEPPNPTEMLNSRRMEEIQEALKERADIVVFDSPPTLSVADAQVMATTVDGVLYVIHIGNHAKQSSGNWFKQASKFGQDLVENTANIFTPKNRKKNKMRNEALSKQQLKHGHELLMQAQARVLGVVLNKYEPESRNDYYGYYGYYGGGTYGNYGGYKATRGDIANGNGNGSGKGHINASANPWDDIESVESKTPRSAIASAAKPDTRPDTTSSNGHKSDSLDSDKE